MSNCRYLGTRVNYNQSEIRNIMSTLYQSQSSALLSNIPNWSEISTGTGPSASLEVCVEERCADNSKPVNVQKIINSSEPVYACISVAKTEKDANNNNIHTCKSGIPLGDLPFSNTLPTAFNGLKTRMCVSLPNITLMKDNVWTSIPDEWR